MAGLGIMADDVQRVLGRLEQGFADLRQRLEDQNRQTEENKRAAIKARSEKEEREDQKHAENLARFDTIERKATLTYGIATMNDRWIEEVGKPLAVRVTAIEDGGKIDAAESRGKKVAYGMVGGAIGVVFTAFTAMTSDLLENIKELFRMITGQE